jgi:hypothetical protein
MLRRWRCWRRSGCRRSEARAGGWASGAGGAGALGLAVTAAPNGGTVAAWAPVSRSGLGFAKRQHRRGGTVAIGSGLPEWAWAGRELQDRMGREWPSPGHGTPAVRPGQGGRKESPGTKNDHTVPGGRRTRRAAGSKRSKRVARGRKTTTPCPAASGRPGDPGDAGPLVRASAASGRPAPAPRTHPFIAADSPNPQPARASRHRGRRRHPASAQQPPRDHQPLDV